MPTAEQIANKVMELYENLKVENVSTIRQVYADDVCFEDPAHGIQGLENLVHYFESMVRNLKSCSFMFHNAVTSDDDIFLTWTMIIEHKTIKRGEAIRVEGSSYLKVRNDKIYYHRDYFDLGMMVYENVPLLGGIVRVIRNRMGR